MIASLLTASSRLDRWLHERLGRPYRIALSVGLVIELIRKLAEMPGRVMKAHELVISVLIILLNAALLLHQLAELGERVVPRSDPHPVKGE
jgi:hypothetical protein